MAFPTVWGNCRRSLYYELKASRLMNQENKAHVDRGTLKPSILDAQSILPSSYEKRGDENQPPDPLEGITGRFTPGTIIDRYRLVRCIGRGGMGEVYLAQHQRLSSRFYAIKFLKSELSESELRQRFEVEIDAMERLRHENIIFAEDAGEFSGNVYLVTEFVDGQDLSAISRQQGGLSVADAAEIILQTARGLQHAYEHALVHRDIKPSNLMLSKDGVVKILDLGLARFVDPNANRQLTGSLQLLGTPDYMSPEQCRSAKSIDIRSDIYSLGCTFYCLLAGRPPFDDNAHQSIVTKLTAHVSEAPKPVSEFAKVAIPEDLRLLIARMLEKEPGGRYQTPAELIEALTPFAADSNLRALIERQPGSASQTDLSTLRSVQVTEEQSKPQLSSILLSTPSILFSVITVLAACFGVWLLIPETTDDDETPLARPNSTTVLNHVDEEPRTAGGGTQDTAVPLKPPLETDPNKTIEATGSPDNATSTQNTSLTENRTSTDETTTTRVPDVSDGSELIGEEHAEGNLAMDGYNVLKTYCLKCHGDDYEYPALDLRDRPTLIRPADESEAPYLVEGSPEDSRLWLRANGGGMPPEKQPQPSDEELSTLRDWIEAGAAFPTATRPKRVFVGERSLIELIDQDLESAAATDRRYLRYFSLTHLWNDDNTTDEQLRLARAAVSKLINSLSSQPRIVIPKIVDPEALVLRIDLRDYGWRNEIQWLAMLRRYPWGLKINSELADRVYQQTNCEIPYIRADWFVHSAARPPLYHELVTLPDHVGVPQELGDVERLLGVDIRSNIDADRVWRAGFSGKSSGISDHNRIVERHDSRYGYFWPSYDSAGDIGRQNFANFPLGPVSPNHPSTKAFEHDGGEFIASLPNGMQFYLLATADGKRIDKGPQSIVRDANQFSGSFDVVNGISCMGCHKLGMLPVTDTIREQWKLQVDSEIVRKVMKLYTPKKEMDALIAADRKRFMDALELTCGSFLRVDVNDQTEISLFPEPVSATARYYDRNLELPDVARELGLPSDLQTAHDAGLRANAEQLSTIIEFNENLKRRGLLPLTIGDSITRQQWENAFPTTVRELNLGQFQMIR